MFQTDIQKGDYVVSIACGTDGQTHEGVIMQINGDVVAVKGENDTILCMKKFTTRAQIPRSKSTWVGKIHAALIKEVV